MSTPRPISPSTTAPRRERQHGFTLLEILMAIAIAGFVLAAAATLLVSVSNIWTSRQERHFFQDHVDGVTEFLRATLNEAGVAVGTGEAADDSEPPASTPNPDLVDGEVSISINRAAPREQPPSTAANSAVTSLVEIEESPITWEKPPGFAAYRDPLLSFRLSHQPPLLINPDNAPGLGIEAFLHFSEQDGLSLLWFSTLQETVDDERDLRRTLLSPYVRSIFYIYWDERFERWEEETTPREGADETFLLPRYLKLVFERDEIVDERIIALPLVSRNALLF